MFDSLKFTPANVIQIAAIVGGLYWQSSELRSEIRVVANDIKWMQVQQNEVRKLIDDSKRDYFANRK